MDEEFRERVAQERERDRIREALWARQFTPQQTLAMGLALTEFHIRLRWAAEHGLISPSGEFLCSSQSTDFTAPFICAQWSECVRGTQMMYEKRRECFNNQCLYVIDRPDEAAQYREHISNGQTTLRPVRPAGNYL